MIYEYAIAPDVLIAWGKDRKDFNSFYDKFGLGTPRIMSDFPELNKLRQQFRQACETAEDSEMHRLTELFKRITEIRIRRLTHDYDSNRTWLENAEEENGRHCFHGIFSMDNPRNHTRILPANYLDVDHPLWHLKSQRFCPRKPQEMADFLSPLLANCMELHFVDPHFGPENARHRRPLGKFLIKVADLHKRRPPIEKIVMHTSDKADDVFFRDHCKLDLPKLIPAGLQLELKRWHQRSGKEGLHGRYILTDIGGVLMERGLDDGKDGESVSIIILERELYLKQWNDYVASPVFELVEQPIVVSGSSKTR